MLTKKDPYKNEVKSKNAKNAASPTSSETANAYPANAPTQQPTKTYASQITQNDKKIPSKTRLTIKYDVGYPNQIYIRGKGANLSWDKGQVLKNTKPDEWVWEPDTQFVNCEFKVLINDRTYEIGDNHILNSGATLVYTPHF